MRQGGWGKWSQRDRSRQGVGCSHSPPIWPGLLCRWVYGARYHSSNPIRHRVCVLSRLRGLLGRHRGSPVVQIVIANDWWWTTIAPKTWLISWGISPSDNLCCPKLLIYIGQNTNDKLRTLSHDVVRFSNLSQARNNLTDSSQSALPRCLPSTLQRLRSHTDGLHTNFNHTDIKDNNIL